jgi:hypothetical protein
MQRVALRETQLQAAPLAVRPSQPVLKALLEAALVLSPEKRQQVLPARQEQPAVPEPPLPSSG